ncbi:hypothetical protein ONZ45_g9728 [Pleurotus djamor]|nr:hypothetical protein ONZ45_g9728 [Pleurotus djamor]
MGNKSLLTFFREQLSTVPPVVTADLAGKVVLVIGANAGIGYETAKHFAKFGAKVILGCRNKSKGEDAVRRMREETGLDAFDLRIIDLASFDTVKAFVDNFDYDKLDILVANAGIIPKDYEETQDGWEMSIVIVASEAHQFVDIPKKVYDSTSVLESISSKELSLPYQTLPKYRIAKALNVIITRALSARLASSSNSPIVACVNPGLCYSDMTTNGDSLVFRILLAILGRSAEEGSRQVIWASIGGPTKSSGGNGSERVLGRVDDEAMRGVYVSFAKIEEPGDFVISEKGKEFENLVWDDTLRVLSKIDERVHPIIDKHSLRR